MEENASTEIIIPWTTATAADFGRVDFEAPLDGCRPVDCFEITTLYRAASLAAQAEPETEESMARARVFEFLAGATGMYLKPQEPVEPFGPMMTFTDGSRSAIASDFRGMSKSWRAWRRRHNALSFGRGSPTWPGCWIESVPAPPLPL